VVTDPDPAPVSFISAYDSKCLDIRGGSVADGAIAQQWGCGGWGNQKFEIWPVSGSPGRFMLVAQHSYKCLDTQGFLSLVRQWACASPSVPQQRFAISSNGGNAYNLRSEQNLGWAVDIYGPNASDGTQLVYLPMSNGWSQRWWIA
ncbi:RICIN domain-containing protein, partial [Rhabdothermincola sp.]|uniref:RICIN domain-containing protein n=1 Tax=Rhabdothermincola sp. TaxID=2820405 RepID=UPI002FE23186